MIKISLRPNLKYPLQLIIWSFIRSVERELIGIFFSVQINLMFLSLMFLGEFIFGLAIFLYQNHYLKQKLKEENKNSVIISPTFAAIKLITNKQDIMKRSDSDFKIFFLIVINAFYDFVEFALSAEVLPKFITASSSIELRLNGILIIIQALCYHHILKLPIFRHQIFSLIIIAICLSLTIIIEFIFQDINIFLSYPKFLLLFLILFLIQLFNSILDLVDKYLFEYNYLNPFKTLMIEGFAGFVYSVIYSIYRNPFSSLIEYYNNNTSENFIILIFLLIIYIALCGIQNSYRVATNKIYSPMAATLSQYFLNPIYIIFSLIVGGDFTSNGKTNYIYFILNIFLSIIISLCGCVYNEFIILFFCNLHQETFSQISSRAESNMNKELIELADDIDEIE